MEENRLQEIREQLDGLDDQIVDLLAERFTLIHEVKKIKKESGMTVYQPDREKAILQRVVTRGTALGLNALLLQALFLQIFAVSKRDQV